MRSIVLSIHPKYVEKILNGEKSFEYRKQLPKERIDYVLIYATVPTQKIVAIGIIDEIITEKPNELWKKTFGASGITKSFFDSYFKNKKIGYAIKFKQILKFNTYLSLSEINIATPPQSFTYFYGNIDILISKTNKIDVNNNFVFLGGVHGSGKTTYTKETLSAFGYKCFSASQLIKQYNGEVNSNKTVKNIDHNQGILLKATQKVLNEYYKVVIDGHFCIINNDGLPQNIPFSFFKELSPKSILVAEISEEQIVENLSTREKIALAIPMNELVTQEHQQAKLIAEELKIPLYFINTFDKKNNLINQARKLFK